MTDATIARTPVTRPNRKRAMAHDRSPPPGYLVERGVNFVLRPPAASVEEALESAAYAVQVGPDVWMPFEAPYLGWVQERFERFSYDTEADGRFEKALDDARLLISAHYDVWLDVDGNRLLYVNDRCSFYETFFLHVVPVDPDDLRRRHRKRGFHNRDFQYVENVLSITGRCVVAKRLPDYPIATIRTGQYRKEGSRYEQLWGGEFVIEGGWIARVVEHAEPVIRAGGFDVYHDGNRLLYTSGECGDESLASLIFLHIFPEDEGDLPAGMHGFHGLDFHFKTRLLWTEWGCAAVVDLPGYEIARIRTGQFVPGRPVLWDVEFEVPNEAETGHVVEDPPA